MDETCDRLRTVCGVAALGAAVPGRDAGAPVLADREEGLPSVFARHEAGAGSVEGLLHKG